MKPLFKIGDRVEVYRSVDGKGNLPESKRVRGTIVSYTKVRHRRVEVYRYRVRHPATWDRSIMINSDYMEDQIREDK